MTQEILRLKKLAGLKLMEAAEGEVITPSQDDLDAEREAALDAEADARADVEDKIEKNVLYALQRVGITLRDNRSIYFDDEETIEMLVEDDAGGIPFTKLNALAQCGIGSQFSIAPAGDFLQIRFTIDPNLAAGSPIDN